MNREKLNFEIINRAVEALGDEVAIAACTTILETVCNGTDGELDEAARTYALSQLNGRPMCPNALVFILQPDGPPKHRVARISAARR